jgi:hypothetical protein
MNRLAPECDEKATPQEYSCSASSDSAGVGYLSNCGDLLVPSVDRAQATALGRSALRQPRKPSPGLTAFNPAKPARCFQQAALPYQIRTG